METNDNITITEEEIINAQINTPENIRYYINRVKNSLNKTQQNNWEYDCYKNIILYKENAFEIIIYASKVILKIKKFKNTDELTSFFDNIMSVISPNFKFDIFNELVSKYAQEYLPVLNVFLFGLTDVNSKVKKYIKNK